MSHKRHPCAFIRTGTSLFGRCHTYLLNKHHYIDLALFRFKNNRDQIDRMPHQCPTFYVVGLAETNRFQSAGASVPQKIGCFELQ